MKIQNTKHEGCHQIPKQYVTKFWGPQISETQKLDH